MIDPYEFDHRPDAGFLGLATAIMALAVRDYKHGSDMARLHSGAFIRGPWFAEIADGMNLSSAKLRRMILSV